MLTVICSRVRIINSRLTASLLRSKIFISLSEVPHRRQSEDVIVKHEKSDHTILNRTKES